MEKELRKVDKTRREKLFSARTEKGRKGAPMTITYSKYLPDMITLLRSKRHLLNRSQNLRTVYPSDPMIAYRRGRNLRDMLVHSKTRYATASRGTLGLL